MDMKNEYLTFNGNFGLLSQDLKMKQQITQNLYFEFETQHASLPDPECPLPSLAAVPSPGFEPPSTELPSDLPVSLFPPDRWLFQGKAAAAAAAYGW